MELRYNFLRQAFLALALLTCSGISMAAGISPGLKPRLDATEQLNASDSVIWIASVTADDGSESVDCDENNQFTVNLRVVIENDGDVTLHPGDANYSLSIVDHYNRDSVLFTQPVEQTLEPNQKSDTILLSVKLDYDAFADGTSFYVKENLSHTIKYGANIKPVPYRPIPVYSIGHRKLADGSTLDFGTTSKPLSKVITLENQGAAPLTIDSIYTPEGFQTTISAARAVSLSRSFSLP